MVFVLLTKVIVFHVQITIVKFGVLKLKKSIEIIFSFDRYRWGHRGLVSDLFNINLYEFLEKVIVGQS